MNQAELSREIVFFKDAMLIWLRGIPIMYSIIKIGDHAFL